MINTGIFGQSSEINDRLKKLEEMSDFAEHCRGLGMKLVVTQGSFDLFHLGHSRYLDKARSFGDILIVGVDSDEKIRHRKGPERPVYPQGERLQLLAAHRSVDVLVLKELAHGKHALIKAVRPDVLIVSQSTKQFSEGDKSELALICGRVEILPPQAETSTSARVQKFKYEVAGRIEKALISAVPGIVKNVLGEES